jgi:hypothetical protein
MQIPKTSLIMALTTVFALGLAAVATAGSLTTPVLFQGGASGQNVCVAVNIGTTPVTVTVTMTGLSGATDSETCTMQPNDVDDACQAFLNGMAFCRVTSTKIASVRAVMMNRSTSTPFTIHTAVEAR